MPVVKIKGRTTSSEDIFSANNQSANSLIYTSADNACLEEFSIELTVGEGWNEKYSPENKNLIQVEKEIILRGHGSIVVEVAEEIRVPHNRYGIVLPTGSLFLARGVLIAAAKVEPAFNGKLKVRMYNTTGRKVRIAKGAKVGSIVFMATESTSALPTIYRNSEISVSRTTTLKRLGKWASNNKVQLITWFLSVISSSMMAVIVTYFFLSKPLAENQNIKDKANVSSENGKR